MEHEVNFEKKKMNKKNKLLIWLGVFVLLILIIPIGIKVYINNYNEHIAKATYYFENEDYADAYEEVDKLFPKSYSKEFVERVQIMKYASSGLSMISSFEQFTDGETHYNSLYMTIMYGLNNVEQHMKRAKEIGIEDRMVAVREKYIEKLTDIFGLTEDEAKDIENYSEHDKEIWLSTKAKQTQEKHNRFASNTSTNTNDSSVASSTNERSLEIVDKHGKIDGDYIRISAAVKNTTELLNFNYIKVQVDYLDESGNIVDSDWTYANSSDTLRPGAQKYFDIMTHRYGDYKNYKIYVVDFNTQ